ncbi:FlaD/FlaE family flagellar protein [Halosegnis marinus]|uniref:FlaD/FlaE family flagellar protein n=1 Tax=Halosegnis marinus TaxID=3034023 RepID=A0ABD5ZPT0_9EURY|nr:FlaD/FlaE family flagellar protein [Halosegnis sp. DT85]
MFGRNTDDDDAQDGEADEATPEPPETEPAEQRGPDTTELGVRIDELEEDIDSTESTVRAIRSSQEEMTESMDEMHETVRRLTGVYDRLVAEDNPFVEGHGSGETTPDASVPADDEDVVSFDDLYDEAEPTDEGADDAAMDDDLFDDYAPGEEPEPEPTAADGGPAATEPPEREPMLTAVPEGYAGDVLVMEWLAALMERSGPAGALRAVDHYEQTGWISASVKERLVSVIGGPSLDVFVDPMQPREPTAHEHTTSHRYLTVLGELDDI